MKYKTKVVLHNNCEVFFDVRKMPGDKDEFGVYLYIPAVDKVGFYIPEDLAGPTKLYPGAPTIRQFYGKIKQDGNTAYRYFVFKCKQADINKVTNDIVDMLNKHIRISREMHANDVGKNFSYKFSFMGHEETVKIIERIEYNEDSANWYAVSHVLLPAVDKNTLPIKIEKYGDPHIISPFFASSYGTRLGGLHNLALDEHSGHYIPERFPGFIEEQTKFYSNESINEAVKEMTNFREELIVSLKKIFEYNCNMFARECTLTDVLSVNSNIQVKVTRNVCYNPYRNQIEVYCVFGIPPEVSKLGINISEPVFFKYHDPGAYGFATQAGYDAFDHAIRRSLEAIKEKYIREIRAKIKNATETMEK